MIITEKPSQAKTIATALADDKVITKLNKKIRFYEIEHNGKSIVIVCAVGHLYNLTERKKPKKDYISFDLEWRPSHELSKSSEFTKPYLETIKSQSKNCDDFYLGCDWDVEGELLGANIIRFVIEKKDSKRMEFSTMTKDEIISSFENAKPHLNFELIESGEARHFADFYWGISSSRALTKSLQNAGMFKLLSSGRVQSPILAILADREKEILNFKSKPYWEIIARLQIDNDELEIFHEDGKIFDHEKADSIYKNCLNKKAKVIKVARKEYLVNPYPAFNITSLQTEAYKNFRYSPKMTLDIAQSLYIKAHISYPRTSSEKLDSRVNYKEILNSLTKIDNFKILSQKILSKPSLKPIQGNKTDPAHIAIYPTKEIPDLESLSKEGKNIYSLIVKRFLAAFSDPAKRESMDILFDINKEKFKVNGKRTINSGWMSFYEPYIRFEEISLPDLKENQEFSVNELIKHEDKTKPPNRFTQGSIISEMEKKNLGTRCLVGDTKVKITNSPVKNIKISDIFKSSKKIGKINNVHFAVNDRKYNCISTYNNSKVASPFTLITRRRLDKNENVYEVGFNDGTSIKLTEEHPILIYSKNSMNYKRVGELNEKDKATSLYFYEDKVGEVILPWKDFISLTNKKTCLYAISEELKKYREKFKLTQYDLANKLNISQSRISAYEIQKIIPLWAFKKINLRKPKYITSLNKKRFITNPFPLKLSSALSKTLAYLVGDGSIDKVKIQRENCYDFRYHNTNYDLLENFIEILNKVFGQNLNLYIKKTKKRKKDKPKYYVRLPAVLGRILFTISNEIIDKKVSKLITQEFYNDFIGALFDDEGHTYKNEPKIFISNTNLELLESVRSMLKKLNIDSTITQEKEKYKKKHWKKSYKLYIRGRYNLQKFLEKIPIIHTKKKQRLINHLTNFYKFGRNKSSTFYEWQILFELNKTKNKGLTSTQLANRLNLNQVNIRNSLRHLIRNNYISVKTIGISKQPRKKILYKLMKPIDQTFYPLLGETVINKDFNTKTIKSIRKIDYGGYVYDITNYKYMPNFTLGNGVIVHNSTRAQILQILYDRNYIKEKSIEVTDIGMAVAETLEKYSPDLVSEKLTRHFENELEQIIDKKKTKEEILEEAKEILTKILEKIKKNEKEIGKFLLEALKETRSKESLLGICPECNGDLKILFSRKTKKKFVACSNYPNCKNTYSLPQGAIIPTEKVCQYCKTPIIKVIRKAKRPFEMCLVYNCKSKESWDKNNNQ